MPLVDAASAVRSALGPLPAGSRFEARLASRLAGHGSFEHLVAELRQRPQGGQEGSLGGVFRVVVVAKLVEGVAVDAIQVAAIQHVEGRAVALRRKDIGAVRVTVRDGVAVG